MEGEQGARILDDRIRKGELSACICNHLCVRNVNRDVHEGDAHIWGATRTSLSTSSSRHSSTIPKCGQCATCPQIRKQLLSPAPQAEYLKAAYATATISPLANTAVAL